MSFEEVYGLLNIKERPFEDKTDKSRKKPLKSIYVERNEFETIMNYFNKLGGVYNATFEFPDGKKAMITPYGDKINIICDDFEKLNELEKLLAGEKNG